MVSLALAKQHLRVTHTDEDALIQQYIDASALLVENMSSNLLTRREVTQEFDAFGTRLPLFWRPSPDAATVEYVDTDDADQTLTDVRIVRDWLYAGDDGWPGIATDTVVAVTYTAGWDETPADLVSAQLLLIGHWHESRSAVSEKPGDEIKMAVESLVHPYRRIYV